MPLEKTPWDGEERRQSAADRKVVAFKIASRAAEGDPLSVEQMFERKINPAQNHLRPGDFKDKELQARVAEILAVAAGGEVAEAVQGNLPFMPSPDVACIASRVQLPNGPRLDVTSSLRPKSPEEDIDNDRVRITIAEQVHAMIGLRRTHLDQDIPTIKHCIIDAEKCFSVAMLDDLNITFSLDPEKSEYTKFVQGLAKDVYDWAKNLPNPNDYGLYFDEKDQLLLKSHPVQPSIPPLDDMRVGCSRGEVAEAGQESQLEILRAEWVISAINLFAHGEEDNAIDILYEGFDNLFKKADFTSCDKIFALLKPENLPIGLILALLTITLPVKERLKEREKFFRESIRSLKKRGDYDDELFCGLE